MERIELTLHHLKGYNVNQCIIVQWLVEDGTAVKAGDAVAEVETCKVTAVLEAGAFGILRHKYHMWDYVDITDVVGWIEVPIEEGGI